MPDHNPTSSALERAIDRAVDAIATLGFLGLVFISFLTMIDVVLRYLNFARFEGLKDLTEVAFGLVIASCFPAGLKKGNAVTVRMLGKALGPVPHAWLDVFGDALMWVFFALCTWQFWARAVLFQTADRTTSTLEWPTAQVWWLVAALMAACVLVQSWVLSESVKAALRGRPRDVHDGHME